MEKDSNAEQEVVLVTGGNGFLGQHIVKVIQERDDDVQEIRVLDLHPYINELGHKERKTVKTFVGDLRDKSSEEVNKAFSGVHSVIHVAALVSYSWPTDIQGLHEHNIVATQNVISLCIDYGISRLVYCSTAEVTMVPYLGNISIIVYQTEAKALPPPIHGDPSCSPPSAISKDKGLVAPGYANSKLRAEKIVLDANGMPLANGLGKLQTVALRPTKLYGECDQNFIPKILKIADYFDGKLIQIAGNGGKQQTTYAGNAAWAHVCAKNSLKKHPESVAGLPIFVTDDTHIDATPRFVERVTGGRGPNPNLPGYQFSAEILKNIERSPYWVTKWYIPMILSYLLAFMSEMVVSWFLHPLFGFTLSISPRYAISYMASVVFYSRLRASISMDYDPIYSMDEAISNSIQYYTKLRWKNKLNFKEKSNNNLLK